MANFLTMRRLLGFRDFFPNEKPRSKEYYGNKVGKDLIQKTTPFFLSYFRGGGAPEIDALFREWFTFYDHKYFNSPSYILIETEYRRIKNHHQGEKHAILSVEALLNMFLWSQSEAKILESIDNLDVTSMLPFLELVLLFNDDVLTNYEKATASISSYSGSRKLQQIILSGSFSQNDLVNIDYAQLLYTQVYKLAKILAYLETQEEYSTLLKKLLDEFSCESKEEYLKAICAAATIPFKSPIPSWNVLSLKNASEKVKSTHILDNIAVSDNSITQIDQDDYLQLRNKPFQKISDEEYRVIFELFLLKKIYNGVIFKLSSYDKNFLGRIRNDFSEGVLLYETLKLVLSQPGSIMFTGEEFKSAKLEREPDFYCRNENNILLFESKDFYMRGEYKLSYDFKIIEGELMKEGRLKKAVTQLITNIERCFLNNITLDNKLDPTKITIYPVIIVHDSLYSAPALNYWVYYWFIDELNLLKERPELKDIDFSSVFPITIIEIDTLILYEQLFKGSKFNLIDLVTRYHDHVRFDAGGNLPPDKIEQHAYQSAISFAEFVREHAHREKVDIDFDILSKLLEQYGVT